MWSLLLGIMIGNLLFYGPSRRVVWYLITGRRPRRRPRRRRPTTDEVIRIKARVIEPPPHGVFRPAVDDLTGGSVIEVDIESWDYVRVMELECLGAHYHRSDGSTKALGWQPVGEELPHDLRTPLAPYDRVVCHNGSTNPWLDLRDLDGR